MKWPAFTSNRRRLAVAVCLLVMLPRSGRTASTLEMMDAEVAGLYQRSQDAVIRVHAEGTTDPSRASLGPAHRVSSGFFIDAAGRFITAATLVEDAAKIWTDWHGRRLSAHLLGRDPRTNLALLQLDADQLTPFLPLGNSDDLRVGSMVVAIGFPYELPSAPVVGFVAGLDISCGRRVFPVNHIRAGCRLSPGQGGGPLLNASGEVVGLVVAAQGDDQCYALPVKAVKKICADITTHGTPQYPWVGLDVSEHQFTNTPAGPPQWEVFVREIFSNTPAATAGFQGRDILLSIATNDIHRSADVLNTMFYRRSGETVSIAVLRAGTTQEVKLVVGQRPSEPAPVPRAISVLVIPTYPAPAGTPTADRR
ncbi:MAG: S1C family serine protease [Verrucomicrobiota bacterium]|jgi:serine protease Do